jgi:hypothetical protein
MRQVESDEREVRLGDNRLLLTELLTAGREAHPTAGGSLPNELILSDRDQPVRKQISSTGKVDIIKKYQRVEDDKKKTNKEWKNKCNWMAVRIDSGDHCGLRVAGCGLRVAGCGLRVAGGGVAEQMENGTKK